MAIPSSFRERKSLFSVEQTIGERKDITVIAKAIYDEVMEQMHIELANMVKMIAGREFQQRIDEMSNSFQKALAAMPAPRVVVTDKAFHIDVKSPTVHVAAATAPVVEFNPQINIPEQLAPEIKFNPQIHIPEQPAPQVVVHAPKKTTTTKSILYEGARPSQIVEETTNE